MNKVIAGRWRGMTLKVPDPACSRPTQQRVKKSMFDILGPSVQGGRVLDLFAGSGSLGIEALSRGAKEASFVEWDAKCLNCLKENLLKLKGERRTVCLNENALKVLSELSKKKERFDLIFMDPPYFKEVTTKCLRRIGECDILTRNAILVVRHPRKESLPPQIGCLSIWRQKRYGETSLSFYQMKTSVTE